MKKTQIAKIPNSLVEQNGTQIMVPYEKTVALFDNNGLVCRVKNGDNSNNPSFGFEVKYINHLFEFNKPYILVKDGLVKQYTVLKSRQDFYVISEELEKQNAKADFVTKTGYYDLFSKLMEAKEGEQVYAIDDEGRLLNPCSKEELNDELRAFINYLQQCNIDYRYDSYGMVYNIKVNGIEIPNKLLDLSNSIYIIKTNGKDIKIKVIRPLLICKSCIRLSIYDMPVNEYSLEQINNLISLSKSEESKRKSLIL